MAANIAELKNKYTTEQANLPTAFNPDAWHAMQARDDALIEDSILHGYAGEEYVYSFSISGNNVTGVSVVGARALASEYGGIKSRIVASVDKSGSLFVFKSFEPLAIQAQMIPQLADQDDFYEVVVEITDIKTGNSIQVRKKETKQERRKNGSAYDRPHYDVIAESKAYRNGVLSILPQAVIKQFKDRCLRAGKNGNEKTIGQLRDGALAFAAKNAIPLDRHSVEQLTYSQIFGLGNAAKDIGAFREAAEALGIVVREEQSAKRIEADDPKTEPKTEPKKTLDEVEPMKLPFTTEVLTKRLSTTNDIDVLDADASLINQYPEEVREHLLKTYKARRAQLKKD